MGNGHGAEFLYGLVAPEKARSILRAADPELLRSDQFSRSSLANRHSFTSPIVRTHEQEWLYGELWAIFASFNRSFMLDIKELEEPLQVIRYPVGGCVDWHVDGQAADAIGVRKLSLSIQLSPSDSYVGGDVEFAAQPSDPFARTFGSVICFPSYCAHRVTPVTQGERLSLVAFAMGPAFR